MDEENIALDGSNNATISSDSSYPTLDEVGALGYEVDKEDSVNVSKTEIELDPTEKGSEKSIDDILKEVDPNEKEEPKKEEVVKDEEFLIKHNGEMKKLERDEVVEYAQKGYDYTQKTQALSEREKEFNARAESFEKQVEAKNLAIAESQAKHQTQLEEYNVLDFALTEMQEKDPGLFEEVARYYQDAVKLQNTPANKAMRQEMAQLRQQIEGLSRGSEKQVNEKEADLIREKFNSEIDLVQKDIFPKLNALGIRVDMEKVKQAWIEGEPSNLTVRQAMDAVYGDQIRKAYESKLKVSRLQNKGASRSIMNAGTSKQSADNKIGRMSWNNLEQGGYKNLI